MTYSTPGLSFDQSAFDPMGIMAVSHTLMGHPLLDFGNLVELARRLEPSGCVRAHSDSAQPGTSFTHAPEMHPIGLSIEDTIRTIEKSKAWMALHNIQNDPVYRTLVDEVLDSVRPRIEEKDPGMCHRAGWIFVTSPGAVTPYHLDHEHNFILQILGNKTLHVFDPLDRSIVSEQALELFHAKHSRERITHSEEIQSRAHVFRVQPGMGAYMPTTAPHWVKNGDNVSITVSFTYYTRRTLRRKTLHRANFLLRKLGIEPAPVTDTGTRDAVKHALFAAQQEAKNRVRAIHPVLLTDKYAVG